MTGNSNTRFIPIPSYDEAVASESALPPSHAAESPVSHSGHHQHPSERQGLLSTQRTSSPPSSPDSSPARETTHGRANGRYAATVESTRSSLGSLDFLGSAPGDRPRPPGRSSHPDVDEVTGLRREMEALEILDPPGDNQAQGRVRTMFVKGFSNITRRFNRFRFRVPRPQLPSWVRFPSLPTVSEEYRPRWFIIARLMGLISIIVLLYVLFLMDGIPGTTGPGAFNPESVRAFAQGSVSEDRLRNLLRRMTAYDHVAGSKGDLYVSRWVEAMFRSTGMERIQLSEYPVYLNYPKPDGRLVAIVEPKEKAWQAKIDEENAYSDPSPQQQQMGVFHGLSRAGDVTGPLVFANRGSAHDFDHLRQSGVLPKGAVALIRASPADHGAGIAVKNAELAGCSGALLYLDPADEAGGGGGARPHALDSVLRGSAGLTNWVLGDVLTPGFVSSRRGKRLNKEKADGLVKIPSLPLSVRDASHLLAVLKGQGKKAPKEWEGKADGVAEWWTGDAQSPMVRVKNDQDENAEQRVWNVVGEFQGFEAKAKKVIIGSPRDSWCFGASSPGSGTAVLLEVMNIFDLLHSQGWRPLRTIEFASWDGSQYNLIGSTEYVEERLSWLRGNTVAYIDLGRGISGNVFEAAGTPSLGPVLERTLGRVNDPVANGTSLRHAWTAGGGGNGGDGKGGSSHSGSLLGRLGVDGDYAPFQYIVGAPSLDLGFSGGAGGPDGQGQPPRHSCYDTFEHLEQVVDPGFAKHRALAQVVALLALEFAQEPIVPVDLKAYAAGLDEEVAKLDRDVRAAKTKGWAGPAGAHQARGPETDDRAPKDPQHWDVSALANAVETLRKAATGFHSWEHQWYKTVYGGVGFETNTQLAGRVTHNDRLVGFDVPLLADVADDSRARRWRRWRRRRGGSGSGSGQRAPGSSSVWSDGPDKGTISARAEGLSSRSPSSSPGLPGRTQFKHRVYGPPLAPFSVTAQSDSSSLSPPAPAELSASSTFPFVRARIADGDWQGGMAEVERTARLLERVAGRLGGVHPAGPGKAAEGGK